MAPALLELLSFLRTLEALEALEAVAFIALLFQEASTRQHLAKRREQAREDVNCAGVLYFEMWNDYNRCETDAKQYFLASFFRLSLVVLPFNAAFAVQNLDWVIFALYACPQIAPAFATGHKEQKVSQSLAW